MTTTRTSKAVREIDAKIAEMEQQRAHITAEWNAIQQASMAFQEKYGPFSAYHRDQQIEHLKTARKILLGEV